MSLETITMQSIPLSVVSRQRAMLIYRDLEQANNLAINKI